MPGLVGQKFVTLCLGRGTVADRLDATRLLSLHASIIRVTVTTYSTVSTHHTYNHTALISI